MPLPISPVRPPTVVIFDLGGVLIDWDPRYLYRRLFTDADAMESFLAEVTTPAWNAEQDADLIEAYHQRWSEMLAGAIEGTVAILEQLRGSVRLFALSNWSAETFPIALERFPFLTWFDGIVISGEVGAAKPDARIFEHLVITYGIEPADAVFIDDNASNVEAAERLGFVALQFVDERSLRADLGRLGLLA